VTSEDAMRESIRECPTCHTRVLPTADEVCPACRRYSFASGELVPSAVTKTAAAGPPVDTLNALIAVFGVLMALATVANLLAAASGRLAAAVPGSPPRWGLVALGAAGLPGLGGLWGLWKRKRWGLYLLDAAAVGVFVLNLRLGVGLVPALLGLLGATTLSVFAVLRWRDLH
jgi:hypothetical protein